MCNFTKIYRHVSAAICITLLLLLSCTFVSASDTTKVEAKSVENATESAVSYKFVLSSGAKSERQVQVGDVLDISIQLVRNVEEVEDDKGTAVERSEVDQRMYAFQNEIQYDATFFSFVPDSFIGQEGVECHDVRRNDQIHAIYVHYLSLEGGKDWADSVRVGTFQMKVIGKVGAGALESRQCEVVYRDGSGSYPVVVEDFVAVVSDACTITFDPCGGSKVKSMSAKQNAVVKAPAAPSREGFGFLGWYTDPDGTELFDFTKPVPHNLYLFAKWAEKVLYEDVLRTDWFMPAVRYVTREEIMTGVTKTEFAPEADVTQAMLLTSLWRKSGSPKIETKRSEDSSLWYNDAVRWAGENGLVETAKDKKFDADAILNREQMVEILYRFAKMHDAEAVEAPSKAEKTDVLADFSDADQVRKTAKDAFRWAIREEVIAGVDGKLAPKENVTRAELAQVLYRMFA